MTKKTKTINITILLSYVLFHIFLITKHEAWRDEAHSFVQMQNLSIKSIIEIMSIDGHPALWYSINTPLIKLGLPFTCFSCISLAAMTLAVAILLFKSTMPYWTRIIILSSSLFIYYNPVICRIYSLVILITTILAVYFKQRYEKPIFYGIIVALLFQSHIVMVGLGIGLLIDCFIEFVKSKNKNVLYGLIIEAIGFIAMILELRQSPAKTVSYEVSPKGLLDNLSPLNILNGFTSVFNKLFGLNFINNSFRQLCVLGFSILLIFGIILWLTILGIKKQIFIYSVRELIISFLGLGAYFAIICLIRPAEHEQMALCGLAILVFAIISFYSNDKVINYYRPYLSIMLVGICVLTWWPTFNNIKYDIKNNFSNAKDAASYISDVSPQNSVIVLQEDQTSSVLYAYLHCFRKDLTIYSVDENRNYLSHNFGKAYNKLTTEEMAQIINTAFPDSAVTYITVDPLQENNNFELIKEFTTQNYWNENYWIYQRRDICL